MTVNNHIIETSIKIPIDPDRPGQWPANVNHAKAWINRLSDDVTNWKAHVTSETFSRIKTPGAIHLIEKLLDDPVSWKLNLGLLWRLPEHRRKRRDADGLRKYAQDAFVAGVNLMVTERWPQGPRLDDTNTRCILDSIQYVPHRVGELAILLGLHLVVDPTVTMICSRCEHRWSVAPALRYPGEDRCVHCGHGGVADTLQPIALKPRQSLRGKILAGKPP